MAESEKPKRQSAARSAGQGNVLSRCYEVHKYINARWELASVFDDREEAIADAKSMFDGSRYSMGVRVLHVVAREDQHGDVAFAEQTVFRQSSVDEHNVEASTRLLRAWQEVEAAREKRRRDSIAPRRRRRRHDRLTVILGLTVVAWIAVIGMVLRQYGII